MDNQITVKGITYIPTENINTSTMQICDACVLHNKEDDVCELDVMIDNYIECNIHHTQVYKISIKEQLKKL